MSKTILIAAMLAGFILPASTVFAGGWTHAPGKGYFKLNEQLIKSDSYFQPSGRKTDITELSRYTTSLYGEFGLVDRLTLVGYIPFYQRISEDRHGSETKTGTGDWELGARIGLLTNRATVVSIQIMAGLPLGDSYTDQEVGLFTGDGEFNQLFSLQVGHSLWPTPGYLKAEIGFNNRESDYSDELRYALEAGFMAGERVGFSAWVRGVKALGTADGEWTRNDQQYVSFGPEINFHITSSAGITAGVTKYTGAHNVLDAPAWDIGVFFNL